MTLLLLHGPPNLVPLVDWVDLPDVYPADAIVAVTRTVGSAWTPATLPATLSFRFPLQRVQAVQLLFTATGVASIFDISTRVSAVAPWTVQHTATGVTAVSLDAYSPPASCYWVSPALDVDACELRFRFGAAEATVVSVLEAAVEFGDVSVVV